MDITESIPAPQLTLSQVYYALLKTKQTSTGPDNIPFWVWKENAAILAPAVPAIWNRSLSTQRWPGAWTQANVYPLPKVDIPVQPQDFRGICVTPVIARTFERVVYNTFGKEGVESYLNNNHRTGDSCTNALLKIQHEFLQALDSNDNRAVRLFTMDFSKAFDRVKHNLLIEKLTQSPLNPTLSTGTSASCLTENKEWSVIILFVIGRMSTAVLLREGSAACICLTCFYTILTSLSTARIAILLSMQGTLLFL